jgi:hypothetical protein
LGVEPQACNGELDAELLERFLAVTGDRPLNVHIAREFPFDQIRPRITPCTITTSGSWRSPSAEASCECSPR